VADLIPTYADPIKESTLMMGLSGGELVLVSQTASVEVELKNDFDKQRHKHQNFGRKKFLGISFATIDVEFTVMPDEDADFFRRVVPLLRQRGKQGTAPALQVVNPQLNRLGVTTCNVLRAKIGQPLARSGRHVRLELEEWSVGPTEPKKSDASAEQFDPSRGGLVDKRLAAKKNT
jgi:hypothetical protein